MSHVAQAETVVSKVRQEKSIVVCKTCNYLTIVTCPACHRCMKCHNAICPVRLVS